MVLLFIEGLGERQLYENVYRKLVILKFVVMLAQKCGQKKLPGTKVLR